MLDLEAACFGHGRTSSLGTGCFFPTSVVLADWHPLFRRSSSTPTKEKTEPGGACSNHASE